MAIRLVPKQAGQGSLTSQTECQMVVNKINEDCKEGNLLAVILEDMIMLKESFCTSSFSFIRREGNNTSHCIAKFAVNLSLEIKWKARFPLWLECKAQIMIEQLI